MRGSKGYVRFAGGEDGDHAGHGLLPEGRHGAGDENTGSDFAGDGEEAPNVTSFVNYRTPFATPDLGECHTCLFVP